jgi:hypothetical protein
MWSDGLSIEAIAEDCDCHASRSQSGVMGESINTKG